MKLSIKAVSNVVFVVSVAALVVLSAAGFVLYSLQASHTANVSTMRTLTSTETVDENISSAAYMFAASSGSMISNAWLITAPLGMHEYAVSVKAEGLEPNGTYIVEGMLVSGSMQTLPLSTDSKTMNTTSAAEFQSNMNGTGLFWIVLTTSPAITFEQVELVYLPGMSMQNATTVATVSFQMISSQTMVHSGSTAGM